MCADVTKTIEVIFGGKDNLSPAIFSAEASISSFDSSVQSVAGPVSGFTADIIKAEAALAAMAVTMLGVAINEAGKFGDAISNIGALSNATAEQNEELSTIITSFARDSVSSIDDINNAAFIAISTGTEWSEVNKTLAASERLAVAGSTELASATGALSRAMNAYGASALEANDYSDILFTTAQKGDTNLSLLAAQIGRVAADAAGAGIPFETLGAAISAVTIAGLSTSDSITKLKALIKDLSNPTDELAKAMGGMSLETHSLDEIMAQLKETTGGSKSALDQLFASTESSTAALILANDASGAFASTLQAMEERTGNVAKNYELMVDQFGRLNQNLVNNIQATLIGVGKPLLEEYGDAVKALSSVFESVDESIKAPNFKPVYTALEDVINKFSATLNGVAEALPEAFADLDFTELLESFEGLGDEFGKIFDAIFGDDLDLTKPEDLSKALQQAINILQTLVGLTTEVVQEFQPVFDAIGEAGRQTSELGDDAESDVGKFLGLMTVLGNFGTALGSALIVINATGTDIGKAFDVIVGSSKVFVNALQVGFATATLAFVEFVEKTNRAASLVTFGDMSKQYEANADEWELIGDGIRDNLLKDAQEMKDGYSQAMDGISDATVAASDSISKSLDEVSEKEIELVKTSDDLRKAHNEAMLAASDFGDAEKKAAEEMEGAIIIAKNLGQSWNPITKAFEDFNEPVEDLTKSLTEYGKTTDKVSEINVKTGGTLSVIESNAVDTSKAFKDAAERSEEFHTAMEELASDERIRAMELSVDLQVAQVEADAKKVEAAFDSVASTINSTNELILGLSTAEAPAWDKFGTNLKKQIEAAEIRARELHESQIALIDAQTKNLTEQTKRMQSDEALIRIDSNGLEPHLDQLLWTILDKVRVRMASNYQDFLVGDSCGGGTA